MSTVSETPETEKKKKCPSRTKILPGKFAGQIFGITWLELDFDLQKRKNMPEIQAIDQSLGYHLGLDDQARRMCVLMFSYHPSITTIGPWRVA